MSESYRTTIDINADPEVVFDYFVKPELLVRWMGEYAKLDARNGGLFRSTSTACSSAGRP